jgi:hypothetical protein
MPTPRMIAAPRPHRGAPGPDGGAYPGVSMRFARAVAAALPRSVACDVRSMLRGNAFHNGKYQGTSDMLSWNASAS